MGAVKAVVAAEARVVADAGAEVDAEITVVTRARAAVALSVDRAAAVGVADAARRQKALRSPSRVTRSNLCESLTLTHRKNLRAAVEDVEVDAGAVVEDAQTLPPTRETPPDTVGAVKAVAAVKDQGVAATKDVPAAPVAKTQNHPPLRAEHRRETLLAATVTHMNLSFFDDDSQQPEEDFDRVEAERTLCASIDEVWALVAEPGWWMNDGPLDDHEVTQGEDGIYRVLDPDAGEWLVAKADEDPMDLVAFHWYPLASDELPEEYATRVEISLVAEGGSVVVHVEETGLASVSDDEDVARQAWEDAAGMWEDVLTVLERFFAEKATC